MPTEPGKVTERRIYRVQDIEKLMDCSKPAAYKLMQKINKALKGKGFLTLSGRVPADFADEMLGLNYKGELA